MNADMAWASLNAALQDREPECAGLDLFTADGLSDADRTVCASICAQCPVIAECASYASAAGVTAGFWAGHLYTVKGKQPSGPRVRAGRPKKNTTPSTTDAEAVPSAPITTEGIES